MPDNENQLTIITDENLPVPMGKNEKAAISDTSATQACKANHVTLRATIKAALVRSVIATSKQLDEGKMSLLIEWVKEEILRAYPSIRLSEIGLAIHLGSVGEYGIVYNLDLNTVISWIKQYMNSETRLNAIKAFNTEKAKLQLAEKTKPSEYEIKQGQKNTTINAFEKFKVDGHINDWGNYIFDALVEFGVIKDIDEKKKIECLRNAKSILRAKYLTPTMNIDRRNQNKRDLEELQKSIFNHRPFVIKVKDLLINSIFKDWIDNGTDLKKLLKDI